MWKIGIIGAGYIAKTHLAAWKQQADAVVAAICDLDEQKARERAEEFELTCSIYTDVDQMLANEDIDVVDIITGPDTHLTMVRKAAQAGKHILCQKPFAPELEQAVEMVEAAKRAGVRLMVTENWRWLASMQNVKRILDSGLLGKIHYVNYNYSNYYTPNIPPEKPIPQPYFREMPKLIMYEMGVHWFDVWRFLFGDPQHIYAIMRTVSPYVLGDDLATVVLGHEHFHGVMQMSWASRRGKFSNKQEELLIETDRNTLLVLGDGTAILLDDEGERELNGPIPWDFEGSFRALQAHFLHALGTGEPFQTSGEHNVRTLEYTFAAYESALAGQAVRFTAN